MPGPRPREGVAIRGAGPFAGGGASGGGTGGALGSFKARAATQVKSARGHRRASRLDPPKGGGRRPRSHGLHVRRYFLEDPTSLLQFPSASRGPHPRCPEGRCTRSRLSGELADPPPPRNLSSHPHPHVWRERVAFPHPLLQREEARLSFCLLGLLVWRAS